jgi:hypothetical protein
LKQFRPGYGISKLRDIDKSKLPELNTAYGAEYFKRIRKDLFGADFKKNRGMGKSDPLKGHHSVSRVQNKLCTKDLFITERDIVYKDEPEEEVGEGGKKKKKKGGAKEEVKLYPHHKYGFAKTGKTAKRELNSVF